MTLSVSVADIVNNSKNPLLAIAPTWNRVLLGEIANIQNGYPFESARFRKDTGFPLLRIRDVGEDTTDCYYQGPWDPAFVVRKGDLVVGMDGDFKCARWHGPDALLNQRVCRIALRSDDYDPSFLDYALPGYLQAINEQTSSVTVKHLSSRSIAEIPLPLPPIIEQRRIVAKIEELFSRLDAGVSALKRVQAALKRYKASVLKAACEGRLVPQDPSDEPAGVLLARILAERRAKWEAKLRAKGKNPNTIAYPLLGEPSSDAVDELPYGWAWTNLGSVFDVTIGGTPSRSKPEYWGGRYSWVSSGEVAFTRIRTTRESITELGLDNSNAKLHPPGTVLLAMIGEGKTRGQVSILDIEACNNQNVAAILCAATPIASEYLYYWLQSRYEQSRKSGAGGMQYALNSERIRNFGFAFPPANEQKRIVSEIDRRLSVIAQVDANVELNLKKATRLRQSILAQAFSGRLMC